MTSRESGRGFAIMRACVDGVTLRSSPGQGTRVVLDKRIHWEAPGPPADALPIARTASLSPAVRTTCGWSEQVR